MVRDEHVVGVEAALWGAAVPIPRRVTTNIELGICKKPSWPASFMIIALEPNDRTRYSRNSSMQWCARSSSFTESFLIKG
jgi:hypothetical protein